MEECGKGESFLRQLSVGGGGGYSYYPPSSSRRWGKGRKDSNGGRLEREMGCGGGVAVKKRVLVVIDNSTGAKHAMMWGLTHVANKGDLLTLLHVLPPASAAAYRRDDAPQLANSLGELCKACRPEVEVEALVIQGPRLGTVLSQVKKLEACVLVLSLSKPSPFCCLFRSSNEEFVEECISRADCLTLAVRKQSKGVGGYLISTRWQKNFWLLA